MQYTSVLALVRRFSLRTAAAWCTACEAVVVGLAAKSQIPFLGVITLAPWGDSRCDLAARALAAYEAEIVMIGSTGTTTIGGVSASSLLYLFADRVLDPLTDKWRRLAITGPSRKVATSCVPSGRNTALVRHCGFGLTARNRRVARSTTETTVKLIGRGIVPAVASAGSRDRLAPSVRFGRIEAASTSTERVVRRRRAIDG